ncbi:MAG: DUF4831 family protein [Polyangiaceae bacterium]|nr:DUF4831 family protein [Polyangiaceae bacterium]
MNYRSGLLGVFAVVFASAGCSSGFKVYPADKAPEGQRYLYYTLPRTVLAVTVPITKTTLAPGDCTVERLAQEIAARPPGYGAPAPGFDGGKKPKGEAGAPDPAKPDASAARQKAEQLLKDAGITPFDPKDASSVSLGDIAIASRAEPDPAHVYAIGLSSGFLSSTQYQFEFSPEGVLGSGSRESQSKVFDYGVAAAGAVADVVGPLIGFGGYAPAGGTCEGVLDDLRNVRAARRAVVEGRGNTQGLSKEALELLLAEQKAAEASLIGRFSGRPSAVRGNVICEHVPGAAPDKPIELFAYSPRGVTAVAAGCSAPLALIDASPGPAPHAVLLTLRRAAAIADKARPPDPPPSDDGRGVYYRIPGHAVIEITRADRGEGKPASGDVLASSRLTIAQFGRIANLPGDIDSGAASLNYAVKLDPETGAVVSYGTPAIPADAE